MSDRVTWSVENGGQIVRFDPLLPLDYVKLAGMTGTGVAPTTVVVDGSAAGGGTWRRTSRGVRQVVIPVATYGHDRGDVGAKLRRLRGVLDDAYTSPVLAATYPDGSVFDAECHYTGGGDAQWGSSDTDGRTYCVWNLQLTCPDPYFTSRAVTSVTVGTSGAGRGLLDGGSLAALHVSGSQALGTVTVTNPGDVEAWPTWTVTGPGTLLTARRAADGAQFQLSGTIPATGVTVDTRAKTAVYADGSNGYGLLVGAPTLWSLPPGTSTAYIQLDGAATGSTVRLAFHERREVVF